ncbi:MAG: hypothetical protein ACJA0Y_000131, partial [Maricaulis maris]
MFVRLPASPLAVVAVVLSLVLVLVPSAVRAQGSERVHTFSEAVDAARSVMMADPTAALSLAERAE